MSKLEENYSWTRMKKEQPKSSRRQDMNSLILNVPPNDQQSKKRQSPQYYQHQLCIVTRRTSNIHTGTWKRQFHYYVFIVSSRTSNIQTTAWKRRLPLFQFSKLTYVKACDFPSCNSILDIGSICYVYGSLARLTTAKAPAATRRATSLFLYKDCVVIIFVIRLILSGV